MSAFADVLDALDQSHDKEFQDVIKGINAAILEKGTKITQINTGVYDVTVYRFCWDVKYDALLRAQGISNVNRERVQNQYQHGDDIITSFRLTRVPTN